MRIVLVIISLLALNVSWACKSCAKGFYDWQKSTLDIHHTYLEEAFNLTKNTVGFTAPVSGRAYGYISLGMYEVTVDFLPKLQSLEGQLNGYNRNTTYDDNRAPIEIAANEADFQLLKYFYRAMPPSNLQRLEQIHDSINNNYKKIYKKKMRLAGIDYGKKVAQDIINWSKTDGADEGFDNNYPEDFVPPSCESCWTKTFPGYLSSLLPYWGTNRPMLTTSQDVANGMNIFDFSTDSLSVMYNEALQVLNNSKDTDNKYEIIAEYWDDGAGYSGTPSGHFFTIAIQFAKVQKISLTDAMELYAKLGVAINEAFISAFHLKYKFNFIRPITYIHQHIDPRFNTRLASPPFPEYPSGHSFQSGAATEVMKSVFGDTLTIVDSTNAFRHDIDGAPRTYSSFTEMSEEISISRLYGGIHFRKTLDNSLMYGRKIGVHVAEKLKCRID
jgi:hypothetical protein